MSGEGAVPPPQKKFEFLPENGGFWCILGLLFYVYAKIGQINRGPPPLDPPLVVHVISLVIVLLSIDLSGNCFH